MIVVVGAGLTGLALGHELRARGVEHLVLEAAGGPGGVIRSARVDGHLLEWGPQRARLTGGLQRLIAELGLQDELLIAPAGLPLFVYSRGKLRRVPFSPGDFVRSDVFSGPAKLRLLLEPLTGGARKGERVADYFTRKVGREAYETLLGPLYGGLYASDPADMIVDLSLGRVLKEFGIGRSLILPLLRRGGTISPPPACSFREGLQTLTTALHRQNADNVRLSSPVRGIDADGAGYRVILENEEVAAKAVILTAPAGEAARVLATVAPAAASAIQRLTYNPLAVVHLLANTGLSGLGYQVSFTEELSTRGVTFNDSLFGRRGVYTVYLGGAKSPGVVKLPEDELGEIARKEFRQVTGCDSEVISVARERMPAWDSSWQGISGMALPAGIRIAANWESRPGMPGRLSQAAQIAASLTGS
jgi:protoporphyrinogen/coproporphyrinogen III oxidase